MEPLVFERGDKTYFVTPVTPFTPGDDEIAEFAFANELKKSAPNPSLLWLRGQYVEADSPNRNGQQWTAGELAVKGLTPMYCPVTVMHDPRTAVGLIADVALLTPDKDNVPRARLDSTMALWQHRFPEVAEEAQENYKAGTLMQSMECLAPHYSCSECGQTFQKLPEGAEREHWCAHLKGEESATAARILGNVCFTGTGLIFGTRGAQGAYRDAHLEIDQAEVAEFHSEAHAQISTKSPPRRNRKVKTVETVEISQSEYDDLRSAKTAAEESAEKVTEITQERDDAQASLEKAEVAQKEAEEKLKEATDKLEAAEEESRKAELASERLGSLGGGFKAKLGEKTSERLTAQAASMSDEDWTARLEELAELVGVKPDEKGKEGDEGTEFSKEEIAGAGLGRGGDTNSGGKDAPSSAERQSVVGSLIGSGDRK